MTPRKQQRRHAQQQQPPHRNPTANQQQHHLQQPQQPQYLSTTDFDSDAAAAANLHSINPQQLLHDSYTDPTQQQQQQQQQPRSNDDLNLAVIRRYNPDILAIISVSTYVVLYSFTPPTEWAKSGVEGTLFVCALQPHVLPLPNSSSKNNGERQAGGEDTVSIERYGVFVLNRRGLENWSTELTSEAGLQITPDYIILQSSATEEEEQEEEARQQQQQQQQQQGAEDEEGDGKKKVVGIWVYEEPAPSSTQEAKAITAEIIRQCCVRAEESRETAVEAIRSRQSQAEGAFYGHVGASGSMGAGMYHQYDPSL